MADRTINGVDIYIDPARLETVQVNGLKRMNVSSTRDLNRMDRLHELFPDVFPSDEFHMAIRKAIYDKVLQLYNNDGPNREVHKSILTFLQNSGWEMGTNGFGFYYEEPLTNFLVIPNRPEVYQVLDEEIMDAYIQSGYQWHYFGWFNPNNPYVRAKRGQVPLRPDTFEALTNLNSKPGEYERVLENMRNGKPTYTEMDQGLEYTKYLGWDIHTIYTAIKNSGLMETVPYRSDPTRNHKVLTWKTVGIQPTHSNKNTFYGRTVSGLRFRHGADRSETMWSLRSTYWETLYRKMFNTQAFINWPLLCQNKGVTHGKLKQVANRVFGIKNVNKMSYDQLCQAIRGVQEETRRSQLTLAKVAEEARPQILLRPGSQLIQVPTRKQFSEGKKITNPYQQYKFVVQLCNTSQTKSDVLQGLTEVGLRYIYPEDMSQYSKETICEDLIEQFQYKAEKYGKIETYCNNPDIPLDLIYALAERAGLDSILPTDWENYSKEQICGMLFKYLRILRDTKSVL